MGKAASNIAIVTSNVDCVLKSICCRPKALFVSRDFGDPVQSTVFPVQSTVFPDRPGPVRSKSTKIYQESFFQ